MKLCILLVCVVKLHIVWTVHKCQYRQKYIISRHSKLVVQNEKLEKINRLMWVWYEIKLHKK
jgi:hypothetical protein